MPIALILGLLPVVQHVVLGVESLFGHGKGAAKKQAATTTIADLLNLFSQVSPDLPGANSSTMKFIDGLIEVTVSYFNDEGVMTHQTQAGKVL
jgi:hypothetical protein